MANIIVYSKAACPYCDRAKQLLTRKGLTYKEIRVDLEPEQLAEMMRKTGRRSLPQIIINDQTIGGFDDLLALERSGKLDVIK